MDSVLRLGLYLAVTGKSPGPREGLLQATTTGSGQSPETILGTEPASHR